MTLTPFVQVVGAILVAFTGAAFATHFGFKRWREQRWIERREQLAEQVLADFYDVRSVLQWVRSPGSFASEGETRKPLREEAPEAAIQVGTSFAAKGT